MKNAFLALALSLLIALPVGVIAETETLEDPGILPDNPFYGFKTFFEDVQMAFTFQEREKVMLNYQFAERRLAEAEVMMQKENSGLVNSLMLKYQARVQEANKLSENMRLRNFTMDEIDQWTEQTVGKHVRVLQRVMENAPEDAQEGLQNALQNAEQNQERVRAMLGNSNQYGQTTTTIGNQNQGSTSQSGNSENGNSSNGNQASSGNNPNA